MEETKWKNEGVLTTLLSDNKALFLQTLVDKLDDLHLKLLLGMITYRLQQGKDKIDLSESLEVQPKSELHSDIEDEDNIEDIIDTENIDLDNKDFLINVETDKISDEEKATAKCNKIKKDVDTTARSANKYEILKKKNRMEKKKNYVAKKGKVCDEKCNECDSIFSSPGHLLRHKVLIHGGEMPKGPFLCEMCPREFSQIAYLNQHRKVHSDDRPFICDACTQGFKSIGGLIDHKKRRHAVEKTYMCDQCSISFSTGSDLKKHSRTHTGERPFKCELCPKSFAQSGNLYTHMNITHTGDRPHKCDQCEKSFSRSTHMKNHIKIVHNGERPYACDQCDKTFTQSHKKRDHINSVHKGERPFECDQCDKTFTRSDLRIKHLKNIHKSVLQVKYALSLPEEQKLHIAEEN